MKRLQSPSLSFPQVVQAMASTSAAANCFWPTSAAGLLLSRLPAGAAQELASLLLLPPRLLLSGRHIGADPQHATAVQRRTHTKHAAPGSSAAGTNKGSPGAAGALRKLGLAEVQHVVAVSSAKGGVGKSTTAGAPLHASASSLMCAGQR